MEVARGVVAGRLVELSRLSVPNTISHLEDDRETVEDREYVEATQAPHLRARDIMFERNRIDMPKRMVV